MSSRLALCVLLLFSVAHSGCLAPFKKKPKAASAFVPQTIPVGTVTLVNSEGKFVLVDNGALPVPPVGGVLRCYPQGVESPTAELLATDVRRRPFTIADIRTGEPRKGDRVIYVPPAVHGSGGLTPPMATPKVTSDQAAGLPGELPLP